MIGIVEPVKTQESLRSDAFCLAYLPISQTEPTGEATLVIRTSGNRDQILAEIRTRIATAAPGLTVKEVATFDDLYADIAANQKRTPLIYVVLMSIFALTAVVTAAVGIFGVMSYSVARRTGEIGIRIALGADSSEIRRLVLRTMLPPVLIGIAAGLIGAFWLTRLLKSLLYQVKTYDPSTIVLASALMLLVAIAAALLPCLRASRIDPIVALKME